VRELVPSAEIANDPDDVHDWPIDRIEIGNMPIEGDGVPPLSFDEFLVDTSTDGIVVARGGRIVFEQYANGMAETRPHILMSVSKSLLGLVAGADRDLISARRGTHIRGIGRRDPRGPFALRAVH
jgi:hypothetical protein